MGQFGFLHRYIPNSSGCDSLIYVNLIINNSSITADSVSSCNSYLWMDGNTYTTSNNSATYTLTNVLGCDSIIMLNLTINNVNTAVTQTTGTLTADLVGAMYQWLDCNNGYTALPNDTNQNFTPIVTGDYAVAVTSGGCADTSACYNVFVVGMNANNNTSNISIYPNPANSLLTIQTTKPLLIEIYSIEGNLIESKKINTTNSFAISNYVNGIYLIKATDNNGGFSYHKLVKQ